MNEYYIVKRKSFWKRYFTCVGIVFLLQFFGIIHLPLFFILTSPIWIALIAAMIKLAIILAVILGLMTMCSKGLKAPEKIETKDLVYEKQISKQELSKDKEKDDHRVVVNNYEYSYTPSYSQKLDENKPKVYTKKMENNR